MNDQRGTKNEEVPAARDRPPLQFTLRTLLVVTVLVALLFGVLRSLAVPPQASAIVLVILVVSVAAALALVAAIAAVSEKDQ